MTQYPDGPPDRDRKGWPHSTTTHWRMSMCCHTTDGRSFGVHYDVAVSLQQFPDADRNLSPEVKAVLEEECTRRARAFAAKEGVTISRMDGEFDWRGNSI